MMHAPNQQELTELVHTISHRVAGFLERESILERDEENSYLNLEEGDEDPMQQVLGCSVSYRIAIGPQQGRKVFTLRTIPAWENDDRFAQVAEEEVQYAEMTPKQMAKRIRQLEDQVYRHAQNLEFEEAARLRD
jgi:hypothetical protein